MFLLSYFDFRFYLFFAYFIVAVVVVGKVLEVNVLHKEKKVNKKN